MIYYYIMVKRTIYIPEWLEAKISDLAKNQRRSFSSQALVMLEYYIGPPTLYYESGWDENMKWSEEERRWTY